MAKQWNLANIWNQAFETIQDEPIKKRNYLYASELGNSYIETYYKLKGTPYTNTFTVANRRKMEAGRLFEGIVRFVLKRAGILKRSQQNADHQLSGCMEVHGRLDFVAGGHVDVQQAQECTDLIKILFEELEFPQIYLQIAENAAAMVKKLAGKKAEPLEIYIYELKSVSDFVYRLLEEGTRALNFHHLQNYHYLLSLNMRLGKVGYLNRDDVRIMEKQVLLNAESHKEYAAWIGQMSEYTKSNTVPPKEPLILFHQDTCSFNKNTMGVEWCKYLQMVYGFENAEVYRDYAVPIAARWNRVYARCVGNAEMTADNKVAIADAKKLFPNWDYLVDLGKLKAEKKKNIQFPTL